MRNACAVPVSQLQDSDIERIKILLTAVSKRLIEAPNWHVVRVMRKGSVHWRRAPGAARLVKQLGPESFDLFGALVSLAIEAGSSSSRDDLRPSERMGRAFLTVGVSAVPVLNLLFFGASMVAPQETDRLKTALFASSSFHIQFLSDQIVRFGGERFERWSLKPSWLDFM